MAAGARVAFGGEPLEGHSIPEVYGAIEPTAVSVPLPELLKPAHFEVVTTEVFGPFQVRQPSLAGQAAAQKALASSALLQAAHSWHITYITLQTLTSTEPTGLMGRRTMFSSIAAYA